MTIIFESIGTIHTPFKTKEGMPIQSGGAKGVKGQIILKETFIKGLTHLDGFSHIILIYYFHQSKGFELLTTPFLDNKKHGVFATRAPKRPNPIGISVVQLHRIENNVLYINNRLIDPNNLPEIVREEIGNNHDALVVLEADQNITHGKVVRVMDLIKKGGADRIAIATKPAEVN